MNFINLTLSDAGVWRTYLGRGGGGGAPKSPPYYINVVPQKMLKEKVADFFFTFPKNVNGVLETTFCSQISVGLAGRGLKWSKVA